MSTLMDIVRRHRESLISLESLTLSEQSTQAVADKQPPQTAEISGESEVNKLSKLSTQHVEPWLDAEQFFKAMKAAGWTWPGVVAWLQVSASVGFFEVHPNDRHKAYDEFSKSR